MNCLKATKISAKTEPNSRTAWVLWMGNYKHFFSILLLALVDAHYCFIALVIVAIGKYSDSNILKIQTQKVAGVESTGNPSQHAVANNAK
jgi:hypothetical protein